MKKILIIDDEELLRRMLKSLIRKDLVREKEMEFEVVEAANGIEGLTVLSKETPDMIILDIHMPYMDGVEFLETIRKEPNYQKIPIVILSAVGERSAVDRMIKLGIADYILKPFDREDVVQKIVKFTSGRAAIFKKPSADRDMTFAQIYRQKALVATKDDKYRSFFKKLFAERIETVFAENGAECMKIFIDQKPEIVLIEENIDVVDEKTTASKIRNIDKEYHSAILLLQTTSTTAPPAPFDDRIPKSFNASLTFKEFAKKALGHRSLVEATLGIVRHMRASLAAAGKQALKTTRDVDVEELPVAKAEEIAAEEYVAVDFKLLEEAGAITLFLVGSQEHLTRLVKTLTEKRDVTEQGLLKDLRDFGVRLAKTLHAWFEAKGALTEIDNPRVKFNNDDFEGKTLEARVVYLVEKKYEVMLAMAVTEDGKSFSA
jgi:CheY-like chemotaxis protein